MNTAGARRYAIPVAFAGCVVAVGVLPSVLTVGGTVVICVLAASGLALIVLRRYLGAAAVAPAQAVGAIGGPDGLRFARLMFYLGVILIGFGSLRPGHGLTASETAFAVSFAACVFAKLRGTRSVSLPASLIVSALVFAVGGAISSIHAHSPGSSLANVGHALAVIVLWVWTGAMVLGTRRQLMIALTLWSVSLAIDGIAAVTQLSGVVPQPGGNRMSGLMPHPNDLGGAAGTALAPALLVATSRESPVPRGLRWLPVALTTVALVLSASVAGLVAGVVGIVIWLSSPLVRAPARVAVVGVVTASLLVLAFAGNKVVSPTRRIEQVVSPPGAAAATGSGQDRLSIVDASWPRIAKNPVVGAGLDDQGSIVTIVTLGASEPVQVHGLPLAAWYEGGIFALIGIFMVLLAFAAAGRRAMAAAVSADEHALTWAMCAALAAFVAYAMANPMVFQQYGWFAGVLVVACALRRDRSKAREPSPAAERAAPVPALGPARAQPVGYGASAAGFS